MSFLVEAIVTVIVWTLIGWILMGILYIAEDIWWRW